MTVIIRPQRFTGDLTVNNNPILTLAHFSHLLYQKFKKTPADADLNTFIDHSLFKFKYHENV